MGRLLMVESWVGATGRLLPPKIPELGHSYTLVTRDPGRYRSSWGRDGHPVLEYADEVVVAETNELEPMLEALGGRSFDGVLTVCDYYVETVRQTAQRLGVPCPFPERVGDVRRKHLMRRCLDVAGLGNARHVAASDWAGVAEGARTLGYPLVLKPSDLASSAFVRIVRDGDGLREAFQALESFPMNFRGQRREPVFLLEEYLEGPEFSVESVSAGGTTTVLGVTDKSVTGDPFFIEDGHMFPADLSDAEERRVTDYVLDVLRAVGFDHGVAHTEIKLTSEGPRIVEINPRLPGNYIVELVERVTGIDMLRTFVELALGKAPSPKVRGRGTGSAAILFLVPDGSGTVRSLSGADEAARSPGVVRCFFEDCVGREIAPAIDNACYLGHVVTRDEEGLGARALARRALDGVRVDFA